MTLIERLNAAWTAAHSRDRTPVAPELLTQSVQEIERLRALFKKVQDHCAGDAHPRWGRDPVTTSSRGYLLDICNNALD